MTRTDATAVRLTAAVMLLACAAASGCAGNGIHDPIASGPGCFTDPNFAYDPTLTCIQKMVFTPSCALIGCHGSTAQAGLRLTSGSTFSKTVGVLSTTDPNFFRVLADDPDNSYLYMKITGDPRIGGSRMPKGFPPLGVSHIAVIREWILRGAMDD
jgi:hypothetical protein